MTEVQSWILIDVGNVLIGFDHATFSTRLHAECVPRARQSELDRDTLHRFFFSQSGADSPVGQLDRGTQDLEWLHSLVCRQFSVDIDGQRFEDLWTSIFFPAVHDHVVDWANAMRDAGVNLAICSDTNAAHWSFLRRQHPRFRSLSDHARCFLSFEMGVIKTEPGYFAQVLRATSAPAAQHVLLDDRMENIEMAKAAGLQAVLFDLANPQSALERVTTIHLARTPHGT